LMGGSQGTCFLSEALIGWLWRDYRGGVIGLCGCWTLDQGGTDVERLKQRFKLFVESTTEDFLYNYGRAAYDVFKYNIGTDTRGDLQRAGAHCVSSDIYIDRVMAWMAGGAAYPEMPLASGYWEYIDPRANQQVDAVAAANNGRFAVAATRYNVEPVDQWLMIQMQIELNLYQMYYPWLAAHYPNLDLVDELEITDDYGRTWQPVPDPPSNLTDLEFNGDGALIVASGTGIYRVDRGSTAIGHLALFEQDLFALAAADGTRMFAYGLPDGLFRSIDGGMTWSPIGVSFDGYARLYDNKQLMMWSQGVLTVARQGAQVMVSENNGASWVTRALPAELANVPYLLAIAGRTFYAIAAGETALHVSTDAGASWSTEAAPYPTFGLRVTGEGDVMVDTNERLAFRSRDRGRTWALEHGFYGLGGATAAWAANGRAIYVDTRGVFRLHTADLGAADGGAPADGSTDGTPGSDGPGSTTPPGRSGGCSCATSGATPGGDIPVPVVVGAAAVLALVRRRRGGAAVSPSTREAHRRTAMPVGERGRTG
jgi:MYXO-CTERM domain-containing protein